MKLNDKNIDKIFKDAAAAQDTPKFKEEYWSEMESIIDENKSKSKLPIYLGSIAVLGVLFSLGYFLNSSPKESYERNEILLSKNEISQEETDELSKSGGVSDNLTPNSFTDTEDEAENTDSKNDVTESTEESLPKSNKSKESFKKESNSARNDLFAKKTDDTININTTDKSSKNHDDYQVNEEGRLNKSVDNDEAQSDDISRLSPREKALTSDLEENKNLIPLNNRIKPNFKFGIEGGLTFAESYQGNTASSSRFSLASIASMNWNNIVVRSGVGISHEKANNLKLRQSSTVYGMNATEYENTLHYNTFTELFIPLEIGYRFHNTTFGIGGQASLLMGTKMTHDSRVNGELIESRSLRNRKDALNTVIGGGYLWVHQHLSRKVEAGVKIGKAFRGRVYDSGFDHNISKPNPIFGQIYVNFTIFDK